MSDSAEKCKRGDPLDFINIYSVAKYQKTRKGDSLVSSGFVGYVKKVKNERGTTNFRTWPYGSSFSSFDSKKSGPIRVRL